MTSDRKFKADVKLKSLLKCCSWNFVIDSVSASCSCSNANFQVRDWFVVGHRFSSAQEWETTRCFVTWDFTKSNVFLRKCSLCWKFFKNLRSWWSWTKTKDRNAHFTSFQQKTQPGRRKPEQFSENSKSRRHVCAFWLTLSFISPTVARTAVYEDLSSQSDNYHVFKTHIDALCLAQFVCLTQGMCSSVTNCWSW